MVRVLRPADTLFSDNRTTPVDGTFTVRAEESETHTLTTQTSFTVEQTREFLEGALETRTELSHSITVENTTSTGVSTQLEYPVFAFGQAFFDYGMRGLHVVYDMDVWEIGDGNNNCWYLPGLSRHGVAVDAPTDEEGWRPRYSGIINQGGVVNPETWTPANIRAGSVVAIFGKFFLEPDRVIVRQGANQWTIQAGSPNFYDSPTQINATLPGNLLPGPASVTVTNVTGIVSNSININIVP